MVGEGDPVILVHGLSASSLWWMRNVPALVDHYTVYLLDLPGFGMMRRFPRRFVIDEVSDLILKWMKAMHIESAPLLGHSMGGYICLWLAAYHPDVVQRLLLVSPAGIPYQKSVGGYVRPLLQEVMHVHPSFVPILAYDALRAGLPTLLRATRDIITRDMRPFLNAVQVPTLLIWGEHDSLVPRVYGDLLRAELPHSRLLILKKAGHVSMFDQPEEFNAAMLAFLRSEALEK